ncbi:MAG: knotted carbamoyltransferase YgeW [Myxococcota bacterium]|jgi:knotted carbamoyltransferase YgeW|nr:knotted carbamoyltransferase YgeW [Myxococcota bacterium]
MTRSLHLDGEAISGLFGHSFLLTQDASREQLDALLSVARAFDAADRAGVKLDWLRSELAYAVFFDNSTRTKSAWSGASARLGMSPVIVDGSSTQVAHGETAEETGAMLGMNAHALGIRHDLILGEGNSFMRDLEGGIAAYLEATGNPRKVPVVNLQCDIDHPTQALADLMWLQETFPDGLEGKKIAMSWAYSPSYAKPLSVPQGIMTLLPRFGAHVTLAHPEGYRLMPDQLMTAERNASAHGGRFEVTDDMDAAFDGAVAVYPKSWGPHDLMMERVAANASGDKLAMADIERRALERNARYTDWICDERRMGLTARGDAMYMHCLPADIGAEVTPGVMDRHRVNVAREANFKVYVIMALLAAAKVPDLVERFARLPLD